MSLFFTTFKNLKGKASFQIFCFLTLIIYSCSLHKDEDEKRVLARVYEEFLYDSDLKNVVPKGTVANDSIMLVKRYINSWVRERLLIKKAEDNLSDTSASTINLEKRILDYRNSLITYAYESELVRQRLDTIVSDDEIQKFYEENQNNFQLKDNIIRVKYVKVSKKAPDILKLKSWYKSSTPKDSMALEDYCRRYAENYFLDNNTWLLFEDLLKEIPLQTYNTELFLKYNRFVEVQDSSSLYFMNIYGFKIKNGISPLSFEKERIKKNILNKRKLTLINTMKENLFEDAFKNKKIEIFE